ncbi:hypothetical protein ACJX0J_005028 (mitochondrion) [Zea mays]
MNFTLLSFLYQRIKSTFGILLPSFGSRLSRWHWDLFGVTQVQKKEFLHFYTICYINRFFFFLKKPLPKLFRRKPNWLLPITAFPIDIGTFVPETINLDLKD